MMRLQCAISAVNSKVQQSWVLVFFVILVIRYFAICCNVHHLLECFNCNCILNINTDSFQLDVFYDINKNGTKT